MGDVVGAGTVGMEAAGTGGADAAMREAVEFAVELSAEEIDVLEAKVGRVLEGLQVTVEKAAGFTQGEGTALGRETESAISTGLTTAQRELEDQLRRQRSVLGTFNIALFGRTGAGKSSLVSALAQLDGSRVSRGESDWTVDVQPIDWESCRLYDTPGINGWGRTRNVSDLEEAARRAVEVADVVLLCFDDQGQQDSEFGKVAAWVQEFRKPAVAVLNSRNLRWRDPARVRSHAQRRTMQKTITEHAENIKDSLAAIGMHDVPIVAIQTKRALHARASEPYRGHDATSLRAQRERVGIDYLYRSSNLGALQGLMAALVAGGGADLRLTSLRESVRAILNSLGSELDVESARLAAPAKYQDEAVALEFKVLGYPPLKGAEGWFAEGSEDRQLLDVAERLRGEPYGSARIGDFERQTKQIVTNELGPVRSAASNRAREFVSSAFASRKKRTDEELKAYAFNEAEIEAAAGRAAKRAAEYLERELHMNAEEKATDFKFSEQMFDVHGNRGRGQRRLGWGVTIAGLIVAALMISNPAGWTSIAVGVGVSVVGAVTGLLGKTLRKGAKKKEDEELQKSQGKVRESVGATFDSIQAQLVREIVDRARLQRIKATRELLADLTVLHESRELLADAADQILDEARGIGRARSGGEVLASVVHDLQHGDGRTSLLGEDWIDSQAAPHAEEQDSAAQLQDMREQDEATLMAAVDEIAEGVGEQDFQAIREHVALFSERYPELAYIHADLEASMRARPKIVMIGDYSTGRVCCTSR